MFVYRLLSDEDIAQCDEDIAQCEEINAFKFIYLNPKFLKKIQSMITGFASIRNLAIRAFSSMKNLELKIYLRPNLVAFSWSQRIN